MIAVVLGIVRVIPRALGLWLFRALGWVLSYLMPERRRVALTNLDIAFGTTLTPAEKTRIATLSFQNSLSLIFDFFKVPQLSPAERAQIVTIHGEEHLKAALALGRGVLAVSAHFGNFPLLLTSMSQQGYPIHVVTRPFKAGWADDFYRGVLGRFGTATFPKDRVAIRILKALKAGEIVGYVLDQNMRAENGIFVDFFGQRACTIKGLATLSGRYGTPILPAFILSEQGGRHVIQIEPAYVPDDLSAMKDQELELTQYFTHRIEAWIRSYPEQWLWTHRRWKTRPAGEPGLYPPRRGIRKLIKQWRRRRRALLKT